MNTDVQKTMAHRTQEAMKPSLSSPEAVWLANSHPLSETFDLFQTLQLARDIDSPRLCIVHTASKEAAELISLYREHYGVNVQGEAGTAWLDLWWPDVGERLGFQATCIIPQLRTQPDVDALWEAIERGDITCVGTDGVISPFPRLRDDLPNPSYVPPPTMETPGLGFPSHICHFPIVLDAALVTWILSVTIAEITAANPAKLMDLYPRKGAIAIGSDADLVVVDTATTRRITLTDLLTSAPFNPWEGREVRAWPVATVLRGKVVARDGKITQERTGRYLSREP